LHLPSPSRSLISLLFPSLHPPLPPSAMPKVQIYSRNVGELGKPNTLICHVSGFHPPNIKLQLLKNDVEIEGAQQSDLAFHQGWHFHLTKSVAFTPKEGEHYSCKVEHSTLRGAKSFTWSE
ncbi:beta-2-microglobulin, partial [Huso huso]